MSFLDKIGSSVAEAGDTITQKTKDLSEQNRLTKEISMRKADREACLKNLGEAVYTAKLQGTTADVDALIEQIKILDGTLRNLTLSLNDIKGIATCESCGADVQSGVQFCPNCGSKMKVQDTVSCPKCNRVFPWGTKFCVGCGTKLV